MARILVVDDDQLDLMIVESLLEEEGHELVFAEDGTSGLKAYEEGQFDLVVTDLVMPGLNGLRLIKEILRVNSKAAIIAISGKSPEHLPLAQDYGAVRTLSKPINREALFQAIEEALAEARR